MVAAHYKERISEAEYLELELRADHRSEYWNGTIVAMAGGTIAHTRQVDGSWHETFARGRDAIVDLTPCGISIPLSEIYEQVKFVAPKR